MILRRPASDDTPAMADVVNAITAIVATTGHRDGCAFRKVSL